MMNFELLFWAIKNGVDTLYEFAYNHAKTTMENHFYENKNSYHVIVYDTIIGKKLKGVTLQSFSDGSIGTGGQAWAVYGFTMTYRETGDKQFLAFALELAKTYINWLPEDLIPFWDFDAANIPNEPKDTSATSIAASGLLELSSLVESKNKAEKYLQLAETIIHNLSNNYKSNPTNSAFLLHCTGHKPHDSDIDASIIFGDYYYLEALVRLSEINDANTTTVASNAIDSK